MDRSAAAAYVCAKAGGMLQKSFVGPRAAKLFSVHSLTELWSLLFSGEVPAVSEIMLADRIEQEAQGRFVAQYVKLIQNYSKPDDIFLTFLRSFEYENLKRIGAALATGRKEMPAVADIAPFAVIHYDRWPDIAAMTADTPFAWYDRVPSVSEQKDFDNRLDMQYMRELWTSANRLPGAERKPVVDFIAHEYAMQNVVWALRLKVYYTMSPEQILPLLAYADDRALPDDVLAGDAVAILNKDISNWEDWSGWKYAQLLNPHEEGTVWSVDPRWVELEARKRFNALMLRKFHAYPLSAMVLVSWFKIKQYEVSMIRTATESLRMNVENADAMKFAGL